ncbi:MAG: DUF3617 domain-containing protein [Deltaproteobacteria bacterium]|nr:DUF3617 domain-containing protein [Deltaproteobacteria bacterium]MCL5276824.1 DUF3617 domain-containing protein [Deltaproteobacteria bacterium]
MGTKSTIGSVIAVLLLVTVALAASPRMKNGLWEITTSMEMKGMPMPFAMKPVTNTQCITKKDVRDPEKTVPKASKDKNCKVKDYKIAGDHVTWKMVCTGKHPMTSTGEMTYSNGTSYEGTMVMDTEGQGSNRVHMTYHFKGKRIGDCK